MMGINICTQDNICPDECVFCGNWLDEHQARGYAGPFGQYCTEECASDHQEQAELYAQVNHLEIRDLICSCNVCTEAGHPTEAEFAEYQSYLCEHAERTDG